MLVEPDCLIFSTSSDIHVTSVISKMTPGTVPFVCDFSRFGKDFSGTIGAGRIDLTLNTGTQINLDRVQRIWWRRPQAFLQHLEADPGISNYIYEENYRFWESALALLKRRPHIAWYNDVDANKAADRKTYQIEVAKDCGLSVPATLVTSSATEAKRFVGEHSSVIFKSYSGNHQFWQPTRHFEFDMVTDFDTLHLCPVIFQEFIDGDWDYRVTIIDDSVEAVRFNTGKSRYKYDVRIDTRNQAERCTLIPELKGKLLDLRKKLGLRYAAIDLRESRSGEFYFFEVNPAGQFLYLDSMAGTQIVKTMADALSSDASVPSDFTATACRARDGFLFSEVDRPFSERVSRRVTHLD